MFSITSNVTFDKVKKRLNNMSKGASSADLNNWGARGVAALSAATPKESGLTAGSWAYRIVNDHNGPRIEWYNTHAAGRSSLAVLIQFGHGTGTGGYVAGIDYINPAMRPVFEKIASEFRKKVS